MCHETVVVNGDTSSLGYIIE